MTENLLQKYNKEDNIEKSPSMEANEKPAMVESMQVEHAGVLIKVAFPRNGSVAKIFMLVQNPISDQGIKNLEKLTNDKPEMKEVAEKVIRDATSPLVFNSENQAQMWLDMLPCSSAENMAIANFLELQPKKD